ncbi:hypothetical protein [Nocardioides daeguensis]|uniref:Uncharacterized protein n=1 Tax=Nocardioides daeguensis TaxID=908359 RepID=A0ABP6WGF1_9ACTN|nr:hypothetical protein [Nocardioides daeguensis]MBV6727920.1 hypothetical protein [Nocardioides daeguensis]MCR1771663.1 hypothetical protein [Nocardioides daeguensis]
MTDDAPANGTPEQPADGPPPPPPPPGSSAPETVIRPPASAIVTDPDDTDATATDDRGSAQPPPPPVGAGVPGPIEPGDPTRAARAGTTAGLVALGAGLLGAAVLIAAFRSRSGDDGLDWSNYGVGLGATAVLFVIAILGALAARRTGGRAREEVVTWPGVAGILATGLMIAVGIDRGDSWVAYLVGGVMVALAVIGYLAARRAAFVVVAILGLALVYGVAFDDVVADSLGDDHPQVITAVLVALFVVVVTLVGWALPSRAVSGVVVGAFGLVGILATLASFAVMRFLGGILDGFFGGMSSGFDAASDDGATFGWVSVSPGFREDDVWWVVVLGGILAVLWALAATVSGHSGFSVLAIAMPALGVPLASVALAAEHPTWWAAITATAGGVLLLGGVALARLRGRRVGPTG